MADLKQINLKCTTISVPQPKEVSVATKSSTGVADTNITFNSTTGTLTIN